MDRAPLILVSNRGPVTFDDEGQHATARWRRRMQRASRRPSVPPDRATTGLATLAEPAVAEPAATEPPAGEPPGPTPTDLA